MNAQEPLNPLFPEDDHETVLPVLSVIVMIVLLKDETTCAMPDETFFFWLTGTKRFDRKKRSPAWAWILKDSSLRPPPGRPLSWPVRNSLRNSFMIGAADLAGGQPARMINYQRNALDLFSNRFHEQNTQICICLDGVTN